MKKPSIYEVYITVNSQEQADRLKQLCIDYNLPIWKNKIGFEYLINSENNFGFSYELFYVGITIDDKTEITEQQFIKLLQDEKESL